LYVEAQSHSVVLVKLGLSVSVLVDFETTLDELDAGRGAHSPWHKALLPAAVGPDRRRRPGSGLTHQTPEQRETAERVKARVEASGK
jgi:hypothetical protein